MGDVKVTRAHREAALRVTWSGDVEPHDSYKTWAETGQHDISPYSGMHDVVLELQRLSRVIADAEERGRAAERADVVAFLDVELPEGVGENAVYRITHGEHVGAASKAVPHG